MLPLPPWTVTCPPPVDVPPAAVTDDPSPTELSPPKICEKPSVAALPVLPASICRALLFPVATSAASTTTVVCELGVNSNDDGFRVHEAPGSLVAVSVAVPSVAEVIVESPIAE